VEGDPLAGVVVDSVEPDDYVNAVLAVLDDEAGIEAAKQKLPASVLERFSHERMLDATLDVYGIQPRAST
jgi:hypothetical protein